MVREALLTKENLGGQWEVYFVNDVAGADLLASAWACVDYYTRQQASAFCFAFGSEADIEFAQIDTVNGGMERLCWKARASIAIAGNSSEADESPLYALDGCPG